MGSLVSKLVTVQNARPTQGRHKDQKCRAPERMSLSKLSENEDARILITEGVEYIRSALDELEMKMGMPLTDAGAYQDQRTRRKAFSRGPLSSRGSHSRPPNYRDGSGSDDEDDISMLMSGGGVQARPNAFSGSIDAFTGNGRHGPRRDDRQDYHDRGGEIRARRARNSRSVNFREAHSSIPPDYLQNGSYPQDIHGGRRRMDNLNREQTRFNTTSHDRMRRDDQGGIASPQAGSGSSTSYDDVDDDQDEEDENGTEQQQEGKGSTNVSPEGNINRARHHPPFPNQGLPFGSGDGSASPAPTRPRPSGFVRPPLPRGRSSLVGGGGGIPPRLTRNASTTAARMKEMPTARPYDADNGEGEGGGDGGGTRSRLRKKDGRTPPLRGRRF